MRTSIPPIASPHGEDTFPFPPRPDAKCVRLAIKFRLAAICRHVFFENLTPLSLGCLVGVPLVTTFLAFSIQVHWLALPLVFFGTFAAMLLIAFVTTFPILCSRGRFEIWISSAGLFKRYRYQDIFFSWNQFVWILERNNDLWLASFSKGCFIPREAFQSDEERREFMVIIRELERTHGSVWRDKWNGRVFGLQRAADDGARNNPR